tara:strand:- start:341 stop:964 length:624 start_codon:yes stop_codon:yes gene_type:complete
MKNLFKLQKFSLYFLLLSGLAITSCNNDDDDDVPAVENEEEVITDVTLVFTNTADSTDVVTASAQDPDGPGVQELQVLGDINLDTSKTYIMTMEVMNNLETPGEDITEEIVEEGHEHQFFFSFTEGAFSNPSGDGNIDNAGDPLVYNDYDVNGNPIGLSTTWTTASTELLGGTFEVRLQHQPDIKSGSSSAQDGDSDIQLYFVLNVQ